MKFQRFDIIVLLLAVLITVIMAKSILLPPVVKNHDALFQVSTIDALQQGKLEGIMSLGELKMQGDFGIGTFEGIDGEMVVLDGKAYQVKYTGIAAQADDSQNIPFAEVTFFEPDINLRLNGTFNISTLTAEITRDLPSSGVYYAIKMHGVFPYAKVRSVPPQGKGHTLADAVANQSVFELKNVSGTIVGYYSPESAKGTGVPGYHLHFITDDGKAGGHLLDLTAVDPAPALDDTPYLSLRLV